MSIASAEKVGLKLPISESTRSYLLAGEPSEQSPVYVALQPSPELDKLRPRLGHLDYVRIDPSEKRIFSVVQFFGSIQLYCVLGSCPSGPTVAIRADHDPVSHEEEYAPAPTINIPVPEKSISADLVRFRMNEAFEKLRSELVSIYGDQAPIKVLL